MSDLINLKQWRILMRRTASEVIRNLEMRVARLERQSNKYKSISLEELKQTPFPSDREERRLLVKEIERKEREEIDARFKRQSAFIKSEIESTGWSVGQIYRDGQANMQCVISIGKFRHTISFGRAWWDGAVKLLASYKKILPLMTSKKKDLMMVASEAVIKDHVGNITFPNLFSRLGVEKFIPQEYPEKAKVETMIRDFARAFFFRNTDFQDEAIEAYQQKHWTPRLEELAERWDLPFEITSHNLWKANKEQTISDDRYEAGMKLLREMDKQEGEWRNRYKSRARDFG
jgi:hypothetical protein